MIEIKYSPIWMRFLLQMTTFTKIYYQTAIWELVKESDNFPQTRNLFFILIS